MKVPIELNYERIYNKIVNRGRGGFCYEINGLHYAMLEKMGFKVELHAARMWRGENFSNEFGHITPIVNFQDIQYISDVGMGDCVFGPINFTELKSGKIVESKSGLKYKLEEDNGLLVFKKYITKDANWRNVCLMQANSISYHDPLNQKGVIVVQTDPNVQFTQRIICTTITNTHRVTLAGLKFIMTRLDGLEKIDKEVSEIEFFNILEKYFNIRLTEEEMKNLDFTKSKQESKAFRHFM